MVWSANNVIGLKAAIFANRYRAMRYVQLERSMKKVEIAHSSYFTYVFGTISTTITESDGKRSATKAHGLIKGVIVSLPAFRTLKDVFKDKIFESTSGKRN